MNTLGRELRASDAMNNSRQWLPLLTLGHELKGIDAMNNTGLWIT